MSALLAKAIELVQLSRESGYNRSELLDIIRQLPEPASRPSAGTSGQLATGAAHIGGAPKAPHRSVFRQHLRAPAVLENRIDKRRAPVSSGLGSRGHR